uniref:Chitinase n=1 Tax=Rhipicephalus appendiculatus TaxID=34631 RepID=A0A131YPT8_RHIAP
MRFSEQNLLSRRDLRAGDTEDPFIKTSYVYTVSSCMLLVVVFFVVLPGALVPYFRKVRYLSDLPKLEDQGRLRQQGLQGPLVLCQLNAESFSRPEPWAYRAEHIPTEHCTHVVFSMPGLKDWFNDLINYDVYHVATRPFFWRAVDLLLERKNAHLLVSVGAFGDVTSLMADVAGNGDTMARFSRNMVRWVLGNKLDGALLAGVFPAPANMRNAMVKMVKKLGTLFRVHHINLGLVVPPQAQLFHTHGAGVKLAQFVDLVVVTVNKEPSVRSAAESALNIGSAIEVLRECGVPASKLVPTFSMEVTVYKFLDTLDSINTTSPVALPYYTVCERIQQGGWELMFDSSTHSNFLHRKHEWINFDDARSIAEKMEVIRNESVAGIMLWDISVDDFKGACGPVHPLVAAVYSSLMTPGKMAEQPLLTVAQEAENSTADHS